MEAENPLPITGIDHVVIRVRDLERMLGFYQDVLGCPLEKGPGELLLAQLRAGSSLIDLVATDGPLGREGGGAPDHSVPNMDHVCLQIHPWDEKAIISHLSHHGVEFDEVAERYGATGMGASIYLRDPEGNRVELKARESTS